MPTVYVMSIHWHTPLDQACPRTNLFVRGRRLASPGRPMEAQQHGALSTPAALNMGGPSLKHASQSTPLSDQKKQSTLNHQCSLQRLFFKREQLNSVLDGAGHRHSRFGGRALHGALARRFQPALSTSPHVGAVRVSLSRPGGWHQTASPHGAKRRPGLTTLLERTGLRPGSLAVSELMYS